MRYAATRYTPLARKYGLDVWEIASAAFIAMLGEATRRARNPWSVVTHAVQRTCGVETRANGMLVSPNQMRHMSRYAGLHDAIRFAERENLADYHPAFAVAPDIDDGDDDSSEDAARVTAALSETVRLFGLAGWNWTLATDCIEHVAYRLADLHSRANASEVLRRDHVIPAVLGVPPRSWTALVRIVLGRPESEHAGTLRGDGVLLRLLSGDTPESLQSDAELGDTIRAACPRTFSKQ